MRIKGFVEVVRFTEVRGWAMDQDDPQAALMVRLVHGETVLAEARADLEHLGMMKAGTGTGRYAFVFNLAARLSPAARAELSVCVVYPDGALSPALPRYGAALSVAAPVAAAVQVEASEQGDDAEPYPVFILGSTRSGTSAITHALLVATRYDGPLEGHTLDFLCPIDQTIQNLSQRRGSMLAEMGDAAMANQLPQDYLRRAIAGVLKKMAADYYPGRYWLDKTPTPEMIQSAPGLAAIWPNAKFIFMRRRGYENLSSKTRKFQESPFRQLCEHWVDCMLAWLEVRDALAGRALEMDQYFLARQPGQAGALISDFLGLTAQEREMLIARFGGRRPEQTEVEVDKVYDGPPAGWTKEQIDIFNEICRPVFNAYGYTEDSRYFLTENPALAAKLIV